MSFTNFGELASGYGKWLIAVGAANTTVLALILTLSKDKGIRRDKHYGILVNALFIGIVACFIGSLLMIETSAISKGEHEFRLFMISAINIHVALALFFLSMTLLSVVYRDSTQITSVSGTVFLTFIGVEVVSFTWVASMIRYAFEYSQIILHIGLTPLIFIISFCIIFFVSVTRISDKRISLFFKLCALSPVVSAIYYVYVLEFDMDSNHPDIPVYALDVVIYFLGIVLPSIIALILGGKSIRSLKNARVGYGGGVIVLPPFPKIGDSLGRQNSRRGKIR